MFFRYYLRDAIFPSSVFLNLISICILFVQVGYVTTICFTCFLVRGIMVSRLGSLFPDTNQQSKLKDC